MNKNIKIRFKKRDFKEKLDFARGYKRQAKSLNVEQTALKKFLLKSRFEFIAALLFVAVLCYLVFIPNFLFIKNVEIYGLKISERDSVNKTVAEYLNKNKFWPQKNLVLLKKNSLKEYLLRQNLNVLSLDSIKKDFPSTLKVYTVPRYAKFYIKASSTVYEISKDGILLGVKNNFSELKPSLKELITETENNWVIGQQIIDKDTLLFADRSFEDLKKIGLNPVQIIAPKRGESALSIKTISDLELKFEITSEWEKVLKNLQALLSQNPDIRSLAYIDLRVPERAYTCQKSALCAKQTENIIPTASSTPF